MTGGDVVDLVLRNAMLSESDQCEAARRWVELLQSVKPEQAHMPISPLEHAQLKAALEQQARVTRGLLAALSDAKARNPAHFRLVAEGGR
jgi:hypothetical protein